MGSSAAHYSDLSIRSQPVRITSSGLLTIDLEPNVFAGLHAERVYLLDCLEQLNKSATDFLRKMVKLKDMLIVYPKSLGPGEGTQKLDWLMRRIRETNLQEEAIIARLGQISFEIQSRDRWAQIEAERHQEPQASLWSTRREGIQMNTTSDNSQPAACTTTNTTSIQEQDCKSSGSPGPTLTENRCVGIATENQSQPDDNIASGNSSPETECIEDEASQTLRNLPRSLSINFSELDLGTSSPYSPALRSRRYSLQDLNLGLDIVYTS